MTDTADVDTTLLDSISSALELRKPNSEAIEAVARTTAHWFDVLDEPSPFECVVDVATGVGKTYIMAGLIDYFAQSDFGVRNFLLLAPGSTIRDKSITNFTRGHRKSIPLASDPVVITAANFNTAEVRSALDDDSRVKLFIFTVQALTTSKEGDRKTDAYQEALGRSLLDHLTACDDLVVLADEHHCYRGPAFSKSITKLAPSVVVGLTATPDKRDTDKVVYRYPLARAIEEGFVKYPVLVARTTGTVDDRVKLIDGVTLLRYKEKALTAHCTDNDLAPVNPVMLVVAQDTDEANKFAEILEAPDFDGGAWGDKTLVIHSKVGDKEKALANLEAVEDPNSPVRIIISVGMLKEGWDVKNVYVIASMRASVSDVLTEQTLGRGLRLPFGNRTGQDMLDTVEVLAHERYKDLMGKRAVLKEKVIDHFTWIASHTPAPAPEHAPSNDPSPEIPVTPPTPSDGNENGSAGTDEVVYPLKVVTLDDEETSGEKETEKILLTPNIHLPLPSREVIEVPKVTYSVEAPSLSLSNISDTSALRDVGAKLRAEAGDSLLRTRIEVEHGAVRAREASDEVKYVVDIRPLEESKKALVSEIMGNPAINATNRNEHKYAQAIVDEVVAGIGDDDAERYLSINLNIARSSVVAFVVGRLSTSVVPSAFGDIETVEKVPLDAARKCSKKHTANLVVPEDYSRTEAYGGWQRNLYEVAWFDSATEYAAAYAIDADPNVVVWARLHINDVPITYTSKGNNYNPDFIVIEDVNGERVHWLVETKMNKEVDSKTVVDKREAAVRWTKQVSAELDENWRYLLISEDDVHHSSGSWSRMKVINSTGV